MAKSVVGLYNDEILLSFDEKEHCYSVEGRKDHPNGVSQLIKETLGMSPAIGQWMANTSVDARDAGMPSKEAKLAHRIVSKEAATIGKEVHAFAERALIEQRVSLPQDPAAQRGAQAFLTWLHATDIRPIDVERFVFSRQHYYAGRCDFYGEIAGKTCVLDLKTSSGLYREMNFQLAAYAIAIEEELGVKIDQGWIIRLDKKTGKCEPYPVPLTQTLKKGFLMIRDLHRILEYNDKLIEEVKQNGLSRQAAA